MHTAKILCFLFIQSIREVIFNTLFTTLHSATICHITIVWNNLCQNQYKTMKKPQITVGLINFTCLNFIINDIKYTPKNIR